MKRFLRLNVMHKHHKYSAGDECDAEHVEALEAQGLLKPIEKEKVIIPEPEAPKKRSKKEQQ
jgi:hypothetical protein